MIRVVADTNVYVSALVFGGRPAEFFALARKRRLILIASKPILNEVDAILARKFALARPAALISLNSLIELVTPRVEIADCVDLDDNRILEAAIEGSADYIVSGDKHLLHMTPFRGVVILKVADFLSKMLEETQEGRVDA